MSGAVPGKVFLSDLKPTDREEIERAFAKHQIVFDPAQPILVNDVATGAFAHLEAEIAKPPEGTRGKSSPVPARRVVINQATARALRPYLKKNPHSEEDSHALRAAQLKRNRKAQKRLGALPTLETRPTPAGSQASSPHSELPQEME